jgi:hypothetical protein
MGSRPEEKPFGRLDRRLQKSKVEAPGVFWRAAARRSVLCAVIGLAVMVTASCGRGVKWPATLEPALQTTKGYDNRDGCQLYGGPGFAVTVCPLDWTDAEDVYRTRKLMNPFGDGGEVMSRLVFFSVTLENHSKEKLFFNPLWVSLFAGAAVPTPPLDVSDIYRINRGADHIEERARTFRHTAFDGTRSVGSGEAIMRHIVFPPPGDAFEEMTVVLQDLYLGGRDFDPAFVFVPVPPPAR